MAAFAASDLDPIVVSANGGNDIVMVDYKNGDPISGGLTFAAATGIADPAIVVTGVTTGTGVSPNYTLAGNSDSGTLTVANSVVDDTINFSGVSTFNLFSGDPAGSLSVMSGTCRFDQDLGSVATAAGTAAAVSLAVASGASVHFGITQQLSSVNIAAGGLVQMVPAGGKVLDVTTLSVAGALDLADNDLIVNDPDSADAATIQEDVAAGVSASATQGIIYSSTAATDGETIGVAPDADLATPLTTLDGQSVSTTTAVVARYTLPGDFQLTGTVSFSDLSEVFSHYNTTPGIAPPVWFDGDANYDGSINFSDLSNVETHYNLTGPAPTGTATAGTGFNLDFPTAAAGDTTTRTDVSWGDGTFDSYGGAVTAASHVYTKTGLDLVQFDTVSLAASGFSTTPGQAETVAVGGSGMASTPTALGYGSGSGSFDQYAISSNGSGGTVVTENGNLIESVPTNSLLSLVLQGTPTDVTIDFTNGDPLPVAGLFTDAARIDLYGPDDGNPLVTTGTTAILGTDELRFGTTTQIVDHLSGTAGLVAVTGISNVSLPFDGTSTAPPVFVGPGASVIVTGSATLSALTVSPGGTFRLAESAGTASLLDVGSLTLDDPDTAGDNGGVLDLSNNDMIARQTPDSVIDGLLANAFDSGIWDAADDGGIDSDATPAAGPSLRRSPVRLPRRTPLRSTPSATNRSARTRTNGTRRTCSMAPPLMPATPS